MFEVICHLLNDEEETFIADSADEALALLSGLVKKYDAAMVQFYQIAPFHE